MKPVVLSALLAVAVCLTPVASAECGRHLSDAKAALQGMKQKALNNQKLDPQASALQLKSYVDKMAREQCMSEMQAFLQYVQSEQQSYPDPRSSPEAYR